MDNATEKSCASYGNASGFYIVDLDLSHSHSHAKDSSARRRFDFLELNLHPTRMRTRQEPHCYRYLLHHSTMDVSSRSSSSNSSADTPPSSPSSIPRGSIGAMDHGPSPPIPLARRAKTVYHPIVSLMVESNTMRDCSQIQSMVSECHQLSNSASNNDLQEPFVCRTAKRYHAMCLSGERS
jgi:hypothetical protein